MSMFPDAPGPLYKIVRIVDDAFHAFFPNRELPILCNLERRLWWKEYQ